MNKHAKKKLIGAEVILKEHVRTNFLELQWCEAKGQLIHDTADGVVSVGVRKATPFHVYVPPSEIKEEEIRQKLVQQREDRADKLYVATQAEEGSLMVQRLARSVFIEVKMSEALRLRVEENKKSISQNGDNKQEKRGEGD